MAACDWSPAWTRLRSARQRATTPSAAWRSARCSGAATQPCRIWTSRRWRNSMSWPAPAPKLLRECFCVSQSSGLAMRQMSLHPTGCTGGDHTLRSCGGTPGIAVKWGEVLPIASPAVPSSHVCGMLALHFSSDGHNLNSLSGRGCPRLRVLWVRMAACTVCRTRPLLSCKLHYACFSLPFSGAAVWCC